jgi:hypothetical protein
MEDGKFLSYYSQDYYDWNKCLIEEAPTFTEEELNAIIKLHGSEGEKPFGVKIQIHTIF